MRLFSVSIRFSLCIIVTSCTSTGGNKPKASKDRVEVLKDVFSSAKIQSCKMLDTQIEIPGKVKSAKLIWSDKGDPLLIYEAAFRDSFKTVLQPLNKNYSINGDGIALGPRDNNNVVDFSMFEDTLHNTWAQYRLKEKEGFVYGAMVEFLEAKTKDVDKNIFMRMVGLVVDLYDEIMGYIEMVPIVGHVVGYINGLIRGGNDLKRIALPIDKGLSAQQLWVMPTEKRGIANVVVRLNHAEAELDDAPEASKFVWYKIDAQKNIAKKIAAYDNVVSPIDSASFAASPVSGEPIALGVVHDRGTSFQLVAKRIFHPSREEVVLAESPAPLASVVSQSLRLKEPAVLVAWLQESQTQAQPAIQHTVVKFGPGFFTSAVNAKNAKGASNVAPIKLKSTLSGQKLTLKSRPVRYSPGHIKFRRLASAGNQQSIGLTWSMSFDKEVGYVSSGVFPADTNDSKLRSIYVPEPKGFLVGVGEGISSSTPDILFLANPPKDESSRSTLYMCSF